MANLNLYAHNKCIGKRFGMFFALQYSNLLTRDRHMLGRGPSRSGRRYDYPEELTPLWYDGRR